MREKNKQCVVTFKSTTQAMAFEKAAKESNLGGRLIPVPRIITAGCGLAWKGSPESKHLIEELLDKHNLENDKIYEITI